MILTGSAAKGAVSLMLVGSLLTACGQNDTSTDEKKENMALEEMTLEKVAVKSPPKSISEEQSLLLEKRYISKRKPTIPEEKLNITAKAIHSEKKTMVAKKNSQGKRKSLLNKRTSDIDQDPVMKKTATASYSTSSEKRAIHSFVANISAYTASADEGTAGGRTASGRKAREGRTIAMSRHIPIGTKVRIEGLPGVYVVEDRGGAIQKNRVDLFVGSKAEARTWGRQNREVYIIEWGNGKVD
jgi:3D (Asp-Asp-Asp) domain-containing protein